MPPRNTPGPATDASGLAVVDPSLNVQALDEATSRRLDDLRLADALHHREIRELTEKWTERLRITEKERIDAVRNVDALNAQRAAEVQATAALALAAQVSQSAEALRSSQAAAAVLADTKLITTLGPIQKRIDDLTRAQSEAVGSKTQVVETQSRAGGVGMWVGVAAAVIFGLGSAGVAVAGLVVTVLVATGVFGGP